MGTATVKAGGLTAEDGSADDAGSWLGWEEGIIRARSVIFALRRTFIMPVGRRVVAFGSVAGSVDDSSVEVGLLASGAISLGASSGFTDGGMDSPAEAGWSAEGFPVSSLGEGAPVADAGAEGTGLIAVIRMPTGTDLVAGLVDGLKEGGRSSRRFLALKKILGQRMAVESCGPFEELNFNGGLSFRGQWTYRR